MQPMQHTLQHTVHMHAYVTGVPGRGPAVRDLGDRRHLLVGEQAPDEQRVLRMCANMLAALALPSLRMTLAAAAAASALRPALPERISMHRHGDRMSSTASHDSQREQQSPVTERYAPPAFSSHCTFMSPLLFGSEQDARHLTHAHYTPASRHAAHKHCAAWVQKAHRAASRRTAPHCAGCSARQHTAPPALLSCPGVPAARDHTLGRYFAAHELASQGILNENWY